MIDDDGLLKRVEHANMIYQAIEDAWWDKIGITITEHFAFRAITAQCAGFEHLGGTE